MSSITPDEEIEKHLDINKVLNRILYKYVSIDDAKLILDNKTLMFSNPSRFNDPLDCYEGFLKYDYTVQELNKIAKEHIKPILSNLKRRDKRVYERKFIKDPNYIRGKQDEVLLKMKGELGICCFSEIPDNILMWSHYARNHTGICIGFNLPIIHEDLFAIYPVLYKDKINGITRTMSYLNAIRHWVLTKASDWSYEKEYRAVSMEYHGIVEIAPSSIVEIYFGCKIGSKDKVDLNKLINKDFKHVKKYQMEINNSSFRLSIKKQI